MDSIALPRLRRLLVVVALALGTLPSAPSSARPNGQDAKDQSAATTSEAPKPGTGGSGVSATALPSIADLVDSVKASVVNVEVTARVAVPNVFEVMPDDETHAPFAPFGGGGGPQVRPHEQMRQGIGSGFIISPDGLVLTNNHVVEGAVSIQVKLEDGRAFEGEVLGRDPLTDVALVRLKGRPANLPVAKLGDSDSLRVGEWVVAIGNPFGLTSSVSLGIISARARNIGAGPYDDFLQTDAAINPGNSGGPLFNLAGEVVGINTAIVGGSGGGSGVGFAVPSHLVNEILPQLEKKGSVTRAWLGISVQDLTPELALGLGVPATQGALVGDVGKGTPGEAAGLKPDDVVVAVDGAQVTSAGALTRTVALKTPGKPATLTVYRGGRKQDLKATLGKRPDLEGIGKAPQKAPDEEARHARLGLVIQDVPPQLAAQYHLPQGALVAEVKPGSPADRAELRPGMVVVEANGKPIKSAADLKRALASAKGGAVALLRVAVGEGKVLKALTVPE